MTGPAQARVAAVLERAVVDRVTPGAIVEIGSSTRATARYTAGALTYAARAPRVSADTVYDLASLTKVIATASLAMQAAASGALPLDARVADRWPAFSGSDRHLVTVEDLLLHAAGFPAHRPFYRLYAGAVGYRAAVAREPLAYVPRSRSEYSDLGFMVLGWLLEDALERPLAEAFDAFAADAIGAGPLAYGLGVTHAGHVAPTEADPWRGRVIAGHVHDSNAAALGGSSGHAGLFGTAGTVGAFARWFLTLWRGGGAPSAGVSADLVARFARRGSVPGSSRGLAWDTMLPTSSCGPLFSTTSIGHTGFTGTSLWIDPARDLYVVLLTNRVHPSSVDTTDAIRELRVAVHAAVARERPAIG